MKIVQKLYIVAYVPEGEKYPVMQIRISKKYDNVNRYMSPVIRRSDPGYLALYEYTKSGKEVVWIYGQNPQPLL